MRSSGKGGRQKVEQWWSAEGGTIEEISQPLQSYLFLSHNLRKLHQDLLSHRISANVS